MIVQLSITQEDYENAYDACSQPGWDGLTDCLVAHTLNRALPDYAPWTVGFTSASSEKLEQPVRFPAHVTQAIDIFMIRRTYTPCTFDLELPE